MTKALHTRVARLEAASLPPEGRELPGSLRDWTDGELKAAILAAMPDWWRALSDDEMKTADELFILCETGYACFEDRSRYAELERLARARMGRADG